MNKKYIWGAGMISALLFTVTGCSSDTTEDLGMEAGKQVSINAKAVCDDGIKTRVYLGNQADNKQQLLWGQYDKIGLYIDNTYSKDNVLKLTSGSATSSAIFGGKITLPSDAPATIAACCPSTAFEGVDLTDQSTTRAFDDTSFYIEVGGISKYLSSVLYAQSDFSLSPTFTFHSRVSILDINLRVDANSLKLPNSIHEYAPKAIIKGCYSKGVLQKDGTWSNLEVADIRKYNFCCDCPYDQDPADILNYHFQIVVIPGSPVKDILIGIEYYTDADDPIPQTFAAFTVSDPYDSQTAVIPANSYITINRTLTKQDFTILDGYGCDTSDGDDGWK